MLTASDKRDIAELKALKQKKLAEYEARKKYEEENKLEFFKPPPRGWKPDVSKLSWFHNPHQAKLFKAWENPTYKTFIMWGGNRQGKSQALVTLLISCLHGHWIWDEFKTPINDVPYKIMLIGQKWEEHIANVLVPKLEELWPKKYKVETKKNQWTKYKWWVPNGSVLNILSNQQGTDSFESSDYDLVLVDEPCREEVYEAFERGLIDRGGRVFFSATLLKEPWIHRRLVNARLADGRPDPTVFNIYSKMTDNIGYGLTKQNVDEYIRKNADKPLLLKARVEGIPTYLEGLIWNLVRDIHLRDKFIRGVPIDWMIDIAIDVHPKEPQAVLFLATSPRGYKYVVDEIFENMSAKQTAQEIVKKVQQYNYRVNKIIIDPAAKADENSPEGSMFTIIDEELARYGLGPLYPGSKDLKSGIDLVKAWLMTENDEPALFIFNDVKRLIWEMEGWMWKPETGKPIDKDDHMCENLRRAIQLETVWYPPEEEEDEDYVPYQPKPNVSTGAWAGQ